MIKSHKYATFILMSTAIAGLASAGNARHMPELLPSNPEAGECYARVSVPAQYRTSRETVQVEAARAEYQVTEPELRARQEQVIVKEASVQYKVRQPTYRSVSDKIMVRPSYERLSVTRPQFNTVTEKIQVSKPRLVWKKGNPATLRAEGYIVHSTADAGRSGRGYRSTREYGRTQSNATLCGPTCEIWCLVEAPGETVSYNRKVMTSAGDVQRIVVPAKYNTITKQVVADPGGVQEIPVPAQYRAITVEDVVKPASVRKVKMRPKYSEVTKKILVAPERYEWRRVVCAPGTRPPAARGYSTPSSLTHSGVSHSPKYTQGAVSAQSTARAISSSHQSRVYGQNSGYQSGRQTVTNTPVNTHHTARTYSARPVHAPSLQGQASHGATNNGQLTDTASGTHYYGSDLPTYSEDYTKPRPRKRQRWR